MRKKQIQEQMGSKTGFGLTLLEHIFRAFTLKSNKLLKKN